MSQAGGGEAPGGTQWLLRGGKMGRVRRRAQTSRQVDVELAQVAVLRGVVAQGPGQTGKSAGAAWQGLWARLGPGRRCPSASRHGQKVPARASKARGVRAARVAKIVTGVGPAAGPSVPSTTVAHRAAQRASEDGVGARLWGASFYDPKSRPVLRPRDCQKQEGEGDERWKAGRECGKAAEVRGQA